MSIRILNEAKNSELLNAQDFISYLLKSEPSLEDKNIRADLVVSANLPGRQLDLILIYEDYRSEEFRFINSKGARIDSFVLIIEVKHHSSDQIKFQGNKLLVRYKERWHDASDQCDAQKYAFKDLQSASYHQNQKMYPVFINNSIWLPRVARQEYQSEGGTVVHFSDLTWHALIDGLSDRKWNEKKVVRTLSAPKKTNKNHTFDTLVELLTKEIVPTKLDKERIRRLNQTRFDAEKTQYIQDLGTGLLMLKGRGGTGKTFSLLQLAFHLSKNGFSSVILTFNHGLIADISRTLRIVSDTWPKDQALPEIMTRYKFIKNTFSGVFGDHTTSDDLEGEELRRTKELLAFDGPIFSRWDFVLVDEGQDWKDIHRDLIFKIFGPEKTIVAHGVDQFVSGSRCTWDLDTIPMNRRHSLRVSRRTKGSTCITISHLAKRLGVKDWDLEPDPDIYGGRVTVFVEPNGPKAMQRAFQLLQEDRTTYRDIEPVDNLICLPDPKSASRVNYMSSFDRGVIELDLNSWRGFDPDDRRVYPFENDKLRSVMYQSCRGMEGWSTVCMGLDQFYDSQFHSFKINKEAVEHSVRQEQPLFFEPEMVEQKIIKMKKDNANQWIMIPLTRSVDHLIIHLTDRDSYIGFHLQEIEREFPGCINWFE